MKNTARTIDSSIINDMQEKSMAIIASSKASDIQPTTLPQSNEYRRREEMAKSCLMEMQVASELSGMFAATPLFGFRTRPAIFAAIMIGFDEGKRPTAALRDYCEIKGATLAKYGAAFLRDFTAWGGSFEIIERSTKRAAIKFTFEDKTTLFEWTIEEARNAGLLTKDNWKHYPADMLYWRCVARGVRSICPQATGGFYLPEEKGMLVDKDGVPFEDSINAKRPLRNSAPLPKQALSKTYEKRKMSPEEIKQWCLSKGEVIKSALLCADSEDILLSIVSDHAKSLDAIKRGYPELHKSLRKTFSEMKTAINFKTTQEEDVSSQEVTSGCKEDQ